MAERKRFVYFGKNQRPSNISYNGVSFPVAPGDIIECPPNLIAHRMSEYRGIKPSEANTAPRHVFGTPSTILRKDPTGGLPMRSSTTKLPAHVNISTAKLLMKDDVVIDNPYELIAEPKMEISTSPATAAKIVVPETRVVDTSAPLNAAPEETDEDVEEETSASAPEVAPSDVPGKAVLRKMTKADIFKEVNKVKKANLPLKPEMEERFDVFDMSSTRGPMFEALWEYYGYNEE